MTSPVSLTAFDDAVIRDVAAENDVEERRLREVLAEHQRTMQSNPGAENLVYEWRKQYDDPVLLRTPERFIVAVPPTVWEEFGAHLDVAEDVFVALTAVHQEETLRTPDTDLTQMPPEHAALVVARTDGEAK